MCEKIIGHSEDNQTNSTAIQHFLQHRGKFGIVAGIATIGLEKFIYEAITKHSHLSRSEVPIHVIADIAGCFLGEKGAGLLKRKGISERYAKAISLSINGASHALYELGHNALHTHNHAHEHDSHVIRLLTLITIKIIGEQLYHNREHKSR